MNYEPMENPDNIKMNQVLAKGGIVTTGKTLSLSSEGLYMSAASLHIVFRNRGFERIKGNDDVTLPVRGTKFSAGYDIASAVRVVLPPNYTAKISTGIKAYMRDNEFLALYIRSSVGKLGLSMVTGVSVIDSDYYGNLDNDGHIFIMLRNTTSEIIVVEAGQKLVQGIFHTYLLTDDDNVSTERTGGTGSTGV